MTTYQVKDDVEQLFFTPAELGTAYVAYGDYIRETPGVRFHVKSLDDYIIPPRPGQMVVVVARPGNGKTSFAIAFVKKTIDEIKSRDAQKQECVVYITYDQPVEEIYSMYQAEVNCTVEDFAWGRVDHDRLVKKSLDKIEDPLFVIGRGMMNREKQPDLTFDNVFRSIAAMESKYHTKPALLVIDYIQNIIIPHKEKRMDMVAEASIQAKDLCKRLACPLIVLAQAGRQVDKSDSKIPGLADCQHSSQLEQDSTKVYGLMRPAVSMTDSPFVKVRVDGRETQLENTQNLLLMQVAKQRMTKAGRVFALYLNPATLQLEDLVQ